MIKVPKTRPRIEVVYFNTPFFSQTCAIVVDKCYDQFWVFPESILLETAMLKSFWRLKRFFINLLQSRLSIVAQIYTSVLKTKVILIEHSFETLPACG